MEKTTRKRAALSAATAVLAMGTAAAGLAAIGAASPASAATAAAARPELAADFCGVNNSDGKLYCGNVAGAKGYAQRSYGSDVRGVLGSDHNWFLCWGHGEPNPGHNDIWYWTELDNGSWGNVPASSLDTGVDPASGLRQC